MDRPIKVVQSLAGAEFGGAENFYTRMVCAMAEVEGISQTACTRENPHRVGQLQAAGVPVETFRFGGRLDLLGRRRYRKALKRLAPDIVLTYMNRASSLTPSGDYQLMCRLGHYYDLKYYRHADYWIGITRGLCDHLVGGGMPANRVIQIPNFADESPVEELTRDQFGVPAGVPLLLAAGRLHVNKAFEILLQALAKIPEAQLMLAGDGPEREALQKQAAELKVSDRVHFLGWRNDVGALMRIADMFVCPSRHEGLGSIVVESWFHGCPIVATASQGPGELITDGETGLVTPVDDAGRLAEAISSLISEPELAQQLATTAGDHYRSHYSRNVIVQRYAEVFRQIVAGAPVS